MQRRIWIDLNVNGPQQLLPAMLVSILDAEGGTHASRQVGGTTVLGRSETSTDFKISVPRGQLFAKLDMPNGTSHVHAVPLAGIGDSHVRFDVGFESPAQDMAWSTTRLRFDSAGHPLKAQAGMQDAWIQRWELREGVWVQLELAQNLIQTHETALQLDLPQSQGPGALVVETGEHLPHVLVLPSGIHLKALLTTTPSGLDRRQTSVVIGGYGSRVEGLLDFLRRGAMDAASQIADDARHYLSEKRRDPLAATAAAYFLLRTRHWELMPAAWLDNLVNWNPSIPDAALIRSCAAIQRGVRTEQAADIAATGIRAAFQSGYPLFAEARDVLEELYSWCSESQLLNRHQDALVKSLLRAAKPAGLTFGFYGQHPGAPGAKGLVPTKAPTRPRTAAYSDRRLLPSSRTLNVQRVELTSLALTTAARARPLGDSAQTLFLRDHL